MFINYPVKAVVEIKQISNKEHIKRFIYDLKNFDHFNKEKYLNISYYFLIVFGGLTEGYIKKVLKSLFQIIFFSHLHFKIISISEEAEVRKDISVEEIFHYDTIEKTRTCAKKFRLSYITISIKPLF